MNKKLGYAELKALCRTALEAIRWVLKWRLKKRKSKKSNFNVTDFARCSKFKRQMPLKQPRLAMVFGSKRRRVLAVRRLAIIILSPQTGLRLVSGAP